MAGTPDFWRAKNRAELPRRHASRPFCRGDVRNYGRLWQIRTAPTALPSRRPPYRSGLSSAMAEPATLAPRDVGTGLFFDLSSEEGLEVAALATVLGEVVAMAVAITVAAVALDAVVAAVVLDAVVVAKIFLAFCVLWIWA